ncbi:hypothetical protein M378DRAFT_90486 [Amanita muscaria Koide BX008]|uniref:hAT-like transposase RNase-H fold domain-containing protein n=1 Tax=Amanita muscaria (strain Koide BX008) TaxID=946122 RepID=A0A0C2WHU4_AMAMK|nr:hypothetical protein M378DRAFT_90486 [Amanita muscaria Koide BX008]
MLDFAIDYRKVIDLITGERDSNLRDYELRRSEWAIALELRNVLNIFKDATTYFSRGSTPNLAMVIPAMDHIDEALVTNIDSDKLSAAVKAALKVGKRTLNRYYSKTDYSETYRIAMVLHPRHKLTYFRNADWPDDWIKTAETIVRTKFEQKYQNVTEPSVRYLYSFPFLSADLL